MKIFIKIYIRFNFSIPICLSFLTLQSYLYSQTSNTDSTVVIINSKDSLIITDTDQIINSQIIKNDTSKVILVKNTNVDNLDTIVVTQNDSTFKSFKRQGASFSQISSFGLSFQNNFFELFIYRLTFFWEDANYSDNFFQLDFNYGLQLQKPIIGDNKNNIYVLVGAGVTGIDLEDVDDITKNFKCNSYGFGLGANVYIIDNIVLNFEFGYGFSNTSKDVRLENQLIDGFNNPKFANETSSRRGTTFGLGFFYAF